MRLKKSVSKSFEVEIQNKFNKTLQSTIKKVSKNLQFIENFYKYILSKTSSTLSKNGEFWMIDLDPRSDTISQNRVDTLRKMTGVLNTIINWDQKATPWIFKTEMFWQN